MYDSMPRRCHVLDCARPPTHFTQGSPVDVTSDGLHGKGDGIQECMPGMKLAFCEQHKPHDAQPIPIDRPHTRRRAMVAISFDFFRGVRAAPGEIVSVVSNDVPADAQVVGFIYDALADDLLLTVESQLLPETVEGQMLPRLRGPVFRAERPDNTFVVGAMQQAALDNWLNQHPSKPATPAKAVNGNPEMDKHAAASGLPHWKCTSAQSNDAWRRIDGAIYHATFRLLGGYPDELRQYDLEHPMKPTPPKPETFRKSDPPKGREFI